MEEEVGAGIAMVGMARGRDRGPRGPCSFLFLQVSASGSCIMPVQRVDAPIFGSMLDGDLGGRSGEEAVDSILDLAPEVVEEAVGVTGSLLRPRVRVGGLGSGLEWLVVLPLATWREIEAITDGSATMVTAGEQDHLLRHSRVGRVHDQHLPRDTKAPASDRRADAKPNSSCFHGHVIE